MNQTVSLPHQLDRTVLIHATPETVFRFLSETPHWATWWGQGSTIDARPGGEMLIRYPNGVEVRGDVVEVSPPTRIVFTYGFVSGTPVAVGGSRVTIQLTPDRAGTRLTLTHQFAEAPARDQHVQGWRYQLALFSNVVADFVNADAAGTIDGWFAAWADADAASRANTLSRIAEPEVRFHDRHGHTNGIADLVPHIDAALRFMPNIRMRRSSEVRHCQGTALADWTATGADGKELARGTNVFTFGPTGLIASVAGLWS